MGYRRGFKKSRSRNNFISNPHFQKGHLNIHHANTTPEPEDRSRNFKRLDRDIYELGHPQPGLAPSILRPQHGVENKDPTLDDHRKYADGNRICHLPTLAAVLSDLYCQHQQSSASCTEPNFKFPADSETFQGLGSYVHIHCLQCGFQSSKYHLFQNELTSSKRGRPRALINVMTGNALMNSGVSMHTFQLICASLDIPPPSEKTLNKNAKSAADVIITEGDKQLHRNRAKLEQFLSHDTEKSAQLATDTCYNNPNKSRYMTLPATQACTPTFEYNTRRKLVVDLSVHSQVCQTGETVCRHSECPTVNYPQGTAMTDVEKKSLISTIKTFEDSSIPIETVLADGSTQLSSVLAQKNIEKHDCIHHLSRGQEREFYRQKWSPGMLNLGSNAEVKKKLSVSIRQRCSTELTKARKKFPHDDNRFFACVERARKNIVPCYEGDHGLCSRNSLVCKPQWRKRTPQLELTPTDKINLQKVIDYKLSPAAVRKQRHLHSTNKVEAFHLRTFHLCPKAKLCKATFKARCYNAVLGDSVGRPKNLMNLGEALGCKYSASVNKAASIMQTDLVQRNLKYSSMSFKQRRCELKNQKLALKRLNKLRTETASNMTSDHTDYCQ